MEISFYLFLALLLFIAFLYSSVGHGGASGYIAIMTLFSFAPTTIKSSALLLNILVSAISFIQYYRANHFSWKLFWPFALTSIPLAYLGALIPLSDDLYKKILGLLLILPIVKLIGTEWKESNEIKEVRIPYALLIGGIIGLLSGMIGIGGGIILSPVILFMRWGNMQQTAAISAPFILVNSISGFTALLNKGISLSENVYYMILVAVIGGLIGSFTGSKKLNTTALKKILAIVLVIASIKLLLS